MVNSIINAANALQQIKAAVDMHANNIANASTSGFVVQKGNFVSTPPRMSSGSVNSGSVYFVQEIQNNLASDYKRLAQDNSNMEYHRGISSQLRISTYPLDEGMIEKIYKAIKAYFYGQPLSDKVVETQINSDISSAIGEFQQKLNLGTNAIHTINTQAPELINRANGLATQYQAINASSPDDARLHQIKAEYSGLAGLPVRQLNNINDASGGYLKGLSLGSSIVSSTMVELEKTFATFQSHINASFGGQVVSGTIKDAVFDSTKVGPPVADIPSNQVGLYNNLVITQQASTDANKALAEQAYSSTYMAMDQSYNVDLGVELANIMALRNQYAAVAKTIKIQDSMTRELLNIIK